MVLTVDIGTTFLKVAVIDFNGKIHHSEKRAINLSTENDTREVDPVLWEKGLRILCSSIPGIYIKKVESIVISGNGPTFIPLDYNGFPIGKALLWNDNRSLIVSDEIEERLGESLPPNFFLSKAYWYKKEFPELYLKTKCFLSCPEYICYLFTGNIFTLLPDVGFMGFYWDDEKIVKLGLDIDKFPTFITPFETFGNTILSDIVPGLKINTPVVCAGPDFTMSILGTGSIKEGILCDRTGTSEGLNFCSKTPINIQGLRTLPHMVPGLFTVAGLIPNSGDYVLNDNLDLLITDYCNIIQEMKNAGLKIKEIRIVGGHASITKLNQMKAKCFPYPIKVYSDGSDLIGNAILGSIVSGYYSTIDEACDTMVKEKFCYNI